MNLIGSRADNHLFIVHSTWIYSGKFERNLPFFADLALLFFVVNEKIFCEDKVSFFETGNYVDPFLDKAFF